MKEGDRRQSIELASGNMAGSTARSSRAVTTATTSSRSGSVSSGDAIRRQVMQVYVGSFSNLYEALSIEASKQTTAGEIVECITEKLGLKESSLYELAEVVGNEGGQDCKERRIGSNEYPVALQSLWPRYNLPPSHRASISSNSSTTSTGTYSCPEYRFCLRRKMMQSMNWSFSWTDSNDSQLLKDYFLRFLYQPRDREYPDLCQLPDLTEQTLLENLKARFDKSHIYTYVGSILIAVNPFKFYPIYNPKYVQLYQNRRLGDLPPHIFAIADAAYQAMLKKRRNQCIVISGESGSGKTESTNLLLHHLTALSQKGSHGSGVEQTILGAGPVLEAFGNAKTKFNNNSSRFGKFIQVNYKENGMVHGAIVQKYLLEKSRIVSQAKNERNYHVFYYMLAGCSEEEKAALHLTKASDYFYLNQSKCYTLDGVDEAYELSRLKQSLEMVGFSAEKQSKLLSLLSAVLHLGNVEFSKKSTYHNDETVIVKNASIVTKISDLLNVREENLLSALTCKRTKAAKGETIIINYKMADAIATRDALAKCLYGCLFDWIVMQVNSALLSKQDLREHKGHSIGVLDIFGFEDFGDQNYFEQFCINLANEHLHYYFNQHVFKYEQEEYQREGIAWSNIDFHDNLNCLNLIQGKPHGLLCLLDDQCNFPGASDETVLQKFVNHHDNNNLFEIPPCRQSAFIIRHYAGKVKYQIRDFREKNMDLMRPDIVSLLKGSSSAFVRELVGFDPLALFRWQILKAFFKAYFFFSKIREESKSKRENDRPVATPRSNNNIAMLTRKLGIECMSSDEKPQLTNNVKNMRNNYNRLANGTLGHVHLPGDQDSCVRCVQGSLVRATSSPCPLHGLLDSKEAKLLLRASKIVEKNKINRTPSQKSTLGIEKSVKNLKTLKVIVGKTTSIQGPNRAGRKTTQTVTFQFQQSLSQLMDTLNQANPFFVRCIKSNSEKIANHFDDMLVLVQLRYTGMLETVRIRQSGYSVRFSFDEFNHHYRILLPRGLNSTESDIRNFLIQRNLNSEYYQIGNSKIFMRESEKLILDNLLHREILSRIITLQRWVRTWITRRRFVHMKDAAICIQAHVRRWIAQQRLANLRDLVTCEKAALTIQRTWKAFKERTNFVKLRAATIEFQAAARGYLSRKEFQRRRSQRKQQQVYQQQMAQQPTTTASPNVDSNSCHSDEAFLSKGSSQEELENDRTLINNNNDSSSTSTITVIPQNVITHRKDSDEDSSGVHDDFSDHEKRKASKVSLTSSGPPLPPRKASLLSTSCESPISVTDIDVHEECEKCASKLDRKKNRPVVRKLSLRKSMSVQCASLDQSPEEIGMLPDFDKPVLRSMTSEPGSMSKSMSDSLPPAEMSPLPSHKPGAFSKAKKTFKTFISGGKQTSLDQVPRNKRGSSEDVLGWGEDEKSPSFSPQSSASQSNFNFESLPSLPNSPSPDTKYYRHVSTSDVLNSTIKSSSFIKHHLSNYVGSRGDLCAVCSKPAIGKDNFRCTECDYVFHTKCYPTAAKYSCHKSLADSMPQLPRPNRPPRSKTGQGRNRSQSVANTSVNTKVASGGPSSSSSSTSIAGRRKGGRGSSSGSSSWNVTRTGEFKDPKDVLVGDVSELHYLETFLSKKISSMEAVASYSKSGKAAPSPKDSVVDIVFKSALKEFKSNLIQTYCVVSDGDPTLHVSYKDLIVHFEEVITSVANRENTYKSFPVIMGVNAFRGFLDEFRSLAANKLPPPGANAENKRKANSSKRRRNKKSKVAKTDDLTEIHGHVFKSSQANIPTVCEVCSSLMWLMEKIWVCQGCKLTCHKKCTAKVTTTCRDNVQQSGKKDGSKDKASRSSSKGVFGVNLDRLVDDDLRVPQVVEDLMRLIELKGLYTEGIYRKSGTQSKINEVKARLDKGDSKMDFEVYSIHVITAVLKSFFREMPEPLLTFELYDDFLWATTISDEVERIQAIYTHIYKLPRSHYDLLERLSFHLARVAQQESSNRMNANSLAIVFAPCILRTDRPMQMQDKLSDISKQTICLQSIISERLRQLNDTLADIDILDSAFKTTSSRLSSLRNSKMVTDHATSHLEEEAFLKQQLDSLRNEKAHLTNILPSFRIASSEEDLLTVDMECSTVGGSIEPDTGSPTGKAPFTLTDPNVVHNLLAPTPIEDPTLTSCNQNLTHLTKNRASTGMSRRRIPSRFKGGASAQKQPPNGSSSQEEQLDPEINSGTKLFHPDDEPVVV